MRNTKERVLGILESMFASKPINYQSEQSKPTAKPAVKEKIVIKPTYKIPKKPSSGVGVGGN